jgi:hypothetical protein
MSRDSLVGIATGWTAKVRFPAEARYSFLFHIVQAESGVHPVSYPMDTGYFPWGVKKPGREADHSPPPNAEVKNGPICFHGMVFN